MATGIQSWSKTANSNASADSAVNWAEGQPPSSVNDSARGMMASTAKYRDDTNGSITTGGIATAFTATSNQNFTTEALMDGAKLSLKFSATSGAAPTLAVDSLTARALQTVSGAAIPTGLITSGSIWTATFVNAIPAWVVHGVPAALPTNAVATAAITDKAVTYAKIQDVSATARVLGRKTSGAGVTEELTLTDVLDLSGSAAQGDVLYRGASDWDNLATGTLGQQLTAGGAAANPSWGPAGGQLLHVQDSVASGTSAQVLSGGGQWNTRRLQTTKTNEISGASLASNQITLPAGTFYIEAQCALSSISGAGQQSSQPRLRNITAGTTLLTGVAGISFIIGGGASQPMYQQCFLRGRFTLSTTTVLEFQHYLTNSGTSGGASVSSGEAEVYSDVQIWRVA